jgi:hypothetical protein
VRLEGLDQIKISMTSWEFEPAMNKVKDSASCNSGEI